MHGLRIVNGMHLGHTNCHHQQHQHRNIIVDGMIRVMWQASGYSLDFNFYFRPAARPPYSIVIVALLHEEPYSDLCPRYGRDTQNRESRADQRVLFGPCHTSWIDYCCCSAAEAPTYLMGVITSFLLSGIGAVIYAVIHVANISLLNYRRAGARKKVVAPPQNAMLILNLNSVFIRPHSLLGYQRMRKVSQGTEWPV